jgi:hypothetical protein
MSTDSVMNMGYVEFAYEMLGYHANNVKATVKNKEG